VHDSAHASADDRLKALLLFEDVMRGLEKRRFQHVIARTIVPNAIRAYEEAKQVDRADEWRRKWLAFLKEQVGAESPAYADALAAWASGLLLRQKWTEAEAVLRECLAVRSKQAPDAWSTFSAYSLLGATLSGQKKYAEAELLLLKGYEGMKQREKTIPRQNTTRIPQSIDRLIELYSATNKPDGVKKWQAERAKYPEIKPSEKK
jgi:hypothetical protein